jgi:glycerol-3-phosphate cytidylyltransferase
MSKFKRHEEQIRIKDSDFHLATSIKEHRVVLNSNDRQNDIVELKKLITIIQNKNIKCWIDYGTLLGAYRKNKVIAHDCDLDVSILFEKEKFDSELLCEILSDHYYIMNHFVNSYICLYPRNNPNFTMVHIDIYFCHLENKTVQSSTWKSIFTPKHFYDELDLITLEGIQFNCPRHLNQYLSFRYGDDFMIEKEKYSPDKNVVVPKDEYIAYTYGVYDMFHIGHLNLFKRIEDNFGKLIVGVHNDEDVMTYKNKPVIPYKDRLEIVKSCKYVDDVYENADLIVTDNLLNKVSADYVVAGRENEQYIKKYYQVHIDKLHLIERTENISTSLIKNNLDSRFTLKL